LKDLPSLYGINDIQDLNRLFSFLAYNAGNEASLNKISMKSDLTKPTITKYTEYLESAFLVMKLRNVDENGRSPKRARNFKIYLNNPSMRAALFAPVSIDETENIGRLTECAIFSQWQHSSQFNGLRYARWPKGEVDIVSLSKEFERPVWIGEVKWSDRIARSPDEVLRNLQHMIERHPTIREALITSKTVSTVIDVGRIGVKVMPSALYCYIVGRNTASASSLFEE